MFTIPVDSLEKYPVNRIGCHKVDDICTQYGNNIDVKRTLLEDGDILRAKKYIPYNKTKRNINKVDENI